ncbi:MAG: bifunctional phosphopantothenoylcysteine decarboxylase/phosphopantothenate--cysteine ligase CoaBC [Eubacterium sp.]|nr:bifunctional phosphopantothenoylcysteine decarboxylase/phosphopantothenate--cysteine ligase CoaBC [Eubacterium sp.]MDD7208684.1 bifunctional phosphopantothenoylcysteine decarboxylase/phosphopantothenate--cysteine ligase CoaBC [Lachnospiraceae bacterium]MDY5497126.1 bifunctional phosphopantothenoylcysteine decarboxylase/phosphopantothenate--cysteine ligase CoaBC [Anaerobutyricum sp.]
MLKGKTVVLGVTGSIAAYKTASLASMLVKQHCDVHVIMTQNATNFINPIAFETLTNHKCLVDTFDRNFQFHVAHVSLAQKADVMMIAPASANIIAKLAHGIADDMLSTTALACSARILVSPAMNVHMFHNPIVQDNINTLKKYGMEVISPVSGYLACGDTGEGKMPEPEELYQYILREIACEKDLKGKKIMVTAGPTREAIDPVRYITNHSTGKMGYAIAKRAMLRGADVTLISGPVELKPIPFVHFIPVVSAQDMFEAVRDGLGECDVLIKSAAVADYRPSEISSEKIKKKDGDMSIALERTTDILGYAGEHKKPGQIFCGFSMETQNMLENSRKKLKKKNLDLIVANNLKQKGAGFGTDTNLVTLISQKEEKELELMSKEDVADRILDYIVYLSK